MPLNKMMHGIKQLNNNEEIKSKMSMKTYLDEIKAMGWKKFWKMNNKVFYTLGTILMFAILILLMLNSKIVTLFKTDIAWANFYMLATSLLFTGFVVYMINFYLTIGIKQDYNTDNFLRTKMDKLKGIDWKSAEEPFLKKKKH